MDLPENHVTTDTKQTISGEKTFTDHLIIGEFDKGDCLQVYRDGITRSDPIAKSTYSYEFPNNGGKIALENNIYPVGSIYITEDDNFSPINHYGGSWEELDSGRFLMSVGKGGKAKQGGGSLAHTHSVGYVDDTKTVALIQANEYEGIGPAIGGREGSYPNGYTPDNVLQVTKFHYEANVGNRTGAFQVVGETKAADVTPLHWKVHIWRRTA